MAVVYNGQSPMKEISQVFSETMEELFKVDPRVVYIDADLMGSLKTKSLWERYPERVFNTGIQEANMVGVACGMFLTGYRPFIHTFSPFASRRVFDQLVVSVAYAQKSVRVIGSDAGICATFNGGTHMCFEDVTMMRAVPGACIVDVSDARMFRKLLIETVDYPGLTYFRTARRDVSDIYTEDERFEIGKGKILREGNDVTIIASGVQVTEALKAANLLESGGISTRVIDIITIKPIDKELIIESAKKTGLLVTVENASVLGGLGDAVSAIVTDEYPVPVIKNGIQDMFGQVGGMEYLREQYKMRSIDIVAQVKSAFNKFKL